MDGCAGPVMGEMADTEDGRVLGSPGCKIGETNALYHISVQNFKKRTRSYLRPAKIGDRCQRVHDLFLLRPSNVSWKRLWSTGYIAR